MKAHHRRAAVVGAAALLALSACSGDTESSSSAPPDSVTLTDEVAAPAGEVDEITWNLPFGEPNTIDPAQSALESVSTVVGNLCEQLMTFGPDYTLEPSLAEEVTQPDDRTFVFDLRPGVTFWDGEEMTADDVVYSMERTMAPATASSWESAFANLDSIEKTGPLQVTVTFKKPSSMFQWFQATPAMTVVEKDFTENAGKKFGTATGGVMCTGPYQVGEWRSGQDLTIVRNDAYWGEKPLVDQVRFTFDTDTASTTAALVRGDVDGQWSNSVASLKRLEDSDEGEVLFGESLSPVFVSSFVNDPAISNPDVRKAMSLMVDYDGITESVYGGAAEPIKTLTPPATWGYSRDIFQAAYDQLPDREQDLAAAKELVEQAGDVPPIELAYNNSSAEESKIALSFQSTAKQVGLTVNLRSLSANDYYKIFYLPEAREGLSAYVVSGYLDFPEPLNYDLYRTKGSYYNYAGYDNPEYDRLLHEAEVTLDDDARAELVTQAEALSSADGYGVPLVTPYVNVFVNQRLTGLMPQQSYLYTPWAASLGAAE